MHSDLLIGLNVSLYGSLLEHWMFIMNDNNIINNNNNQIIIMYSYANTNEIHLTRIEVVGWGKEYPPLTFYRLYILTCKLSTCLTDINPVGIMMASCCVKYEYRIITAELCASV